MNQTGNYSLNQWEQSDRIRMEDFNRDNSKIDAALKASADAVASAQTVLSTRGNCRIYYGTYTGTGSGATALSFPQKPLFVSVMGDNIWITAIQGVSVAIGKNAGELSCGYNSAAWSGNALSLTNSGGNMSAQCNASGTTYRVVALMDAEE